MDLFKKYWPYFSSLLGIALAVLVFFTPELLSMGPGRGIFIRAIERKTHTTASIDILQLSWFGPQRMTGLSMQGKDFDGKIQSLQAGVPLWSLSSLFELEDLQKITGDIRIEGGTFEFRSDDQTVTLEDAGGFLHMHDQKADFVFNGNAGNGSLTFQGQLKEGLSQFSVRGNLVAFPTLPLAHVLASRFEIDRQAFLQILGAEINLDLSTSYDEEEKGFVDLSLHTLNIDGEAHCTFADRALLLRQALTATFRLTPALSQTLLADASPLFVTGISSQKPIQLRIEPSNFRWPLPLKFHDLQIGQGTLDADRVLCQNGGALSLLISILKKDYFGAANEMEVWFSPLSFKIRDGVLQAGRMDALAAGSIHLCSWGNIDLEDSRLDMNLGLPADTLRSVFGIRNVSNEYVLKIHLSGPLKEPKLATSTAIAKIAALLATQKTTKSLPGGIVGLFTQTQTDVPPPSRPFPWER